MLILGIETSCDETATAILQDDKILSNFVFSQDKIHAQFGGIVPEVAARKHIETIIPAIDYVFKNAKLSLNQIDLIAVTLGPGLITSLMVGVDTAKTLAFVSKKPLAAINHLEGHIYSNWLSANKSPISPPTADPPKADNQFPILCLIVSGGHTELVLMPNHGRYKVIGQTRDDAAGEAFDKVAKLLQVGYPGGPAISKLADFGNSKAYSFPRPMIREPNFDFSFSGLKTDVLRLVKKKKGKFSDQEIKNICASFQAAVVDVLVLKTIRAAKYYHVKTILLAGGVTANRLLRKKMADTINKEMPKIHFHFPDPKFCTDNAAMVALAGYFHAQRKDFTSWDKIKVDPNLRLNHMLSKNWLGFSP
jgi:N6-L-threonylcarbamoyladenine synthase